MVIFQRLALKVTRDPRYKRARFQPLGAKPMDLTTLITVAGLFLSVVVGNAAIFGDSLFASIVVPKNLETAGFDKPTAERLFASEVAWYTRLPSILPTPSVATSSSPSVTMALAKPFQLQDVVYAIQSQLRYDVVSATGAIMEVPNSKALSMLVIVNSPPDAPVTFMLNQPDGDAKTLVTNAARETMITIAPYRVALSDLSGVLTGDANALATARETAERGLGQPWDPSPQGATEIVLLHNLLGVLAIERGDIDVARRHFDLGHTTPGASGSSYGLLYFNDAFLALTQRKPAEAHRLFKLGQAKLGSSIQQALRGRVTVLEGLIAWQAGRLDRAEKLLREAWAESSAEVEPPYYISRMLREQGDLQGAQEADNAAKIAVRYDQHYASLAHTVFAIDVKTGALDRRAFIPDGVNLTPSTGTSTAAGKAPAAPVPGTSAPAKP